MANGRFSKHSTTPSFSTEQYNPFSDSNADVVVITDPPVVCPAAPEVVSFVNICEYVYRIIFWLINSSMMLVHPNTYTSTISMVVFVQFSHPQSYHSHDIIDSVD